MVMFLIMIKLTHCFWTALSLKQHFPGLCSVSFIVFSGSAELVSALSRRALSYWLSAVPDSAMSRKNETILYEFANFLQKRLFYVFWLRGAKIFALSRVKKLKIVAHLFLVNMYYKALTDMATWQIFFPSSEREAFASDWERYKETI